ncbi:glycine--tRNA ligase beta subunit [Striga asiatica]|uniref:Glycine--tRNA ligase beta subunit n=1 Tax=Striga asiatica TaxID=4170 RepID=A0A5A7QK71_STRAF|nr:glycine--tRNA ligase beta subunit [Striga asiatica]
MSILMRAIMPLISTRNFTSRVPEILSPISENCSLIKYLNPTFTGTLQVLFFTFSAFRKAHNGTEIISMPFTKAYASSDWLVSGIKVTNSFVKDFKPRASAVSEALKLPSKVKGPAKTVNKSFNPLKPLTEGEEFSDLGPLGTSVLSGTSSPDINRLLAVEIADEPLICAYEVDFGFMTSPIHSQPSSAVDLPVEPQLTKRSTATCVVGLLLLFVNVMRKQKQKHSKGIETVYRFMIVF